MTDARDIAANAVSKPGKVPTIFHVVPESHYDFISTEYKQQPEREAYKIKKITEQQIIYFNTNSSKEITTKKTKKAAASTAIELSIKTSPLCSNFEPEKWTTEKFLIHNSYSDKKRFDYKIDKLVNEAYKTLVQKLKTQIK